LVTATTVTSSGDLPADAQDAAIRSWTAAQFAAISAALDPCCDIPTSLHQ
jgi:hypothetical protein